MKQILLWGMTLTLLCFSAATWAQLTDPPPAFVLSGAPSFSRGFGFGARAMGMAGAFIAVGDDSTAASWNPAGLGRMNGPEFGLVGHSWTSENTSTPYISDYQANIHYSQTGINGFSDKSTTNSFDLVSVAYPWKISDKQKIVIQGSYQRNFLFPGKRTISYNSNKLALGGVTFNNLKSDIIDDQKGGLDSYAMTFAANLGKKFYVGLGINFWNGKEDRNLWIHQYGDYQAVEGGVTYPFYHYLQVDYSAKYTGTSLNLGFLYELSKKTSIGFIYKPGFTLKYERHGQDPVETLSDGFKPWNQEGTGLPSIENSGDISWPDQYGLGFAWRPTPTLTYALDYSMIRWSSAKYKDNNGNTYNYPIDPTFTLDYPIFAGESTKASDSTNVRLGMEKLFASKAGIWALGGGLFYNKTLENSIFYSQPTVLGITAGGGLVYKKMILDIAFVYDTSKADYNSNTLGDPTNAKVEWSGDAKKNNNFSAFLSLFFRL